MFHYQKITYILFFTLVFNPFTFSFANTKIIYEKANDLANTYIYNSINDENWKWKNPQIKQKWKYYYTDDENNLSYIEFKVSCEKTANCWFVLVNIDWDDVSVPIASTSWVWPWEILTSKSWDSENTKLYYFWSLDQYAQNNTTKEVHSLKPEYNFTPKAKKLLYYEKNSNLSKEEQTKELEKHNEEFMIKLFKY